MNGKDLFEGLSFIDERYIDEAENCELPRPAASSWFRVAAMAACLCLVLLSIWRIHPGEPHETTPPTTLPYLVPEGYTEVIVYVEEMTDEGFTGTVTELVTPDLFQIGMELNVVFEEEVWYERADGSFGSTKDQKPDFSGSYVLVVCTEYDPDAETIVVDHIWEVTLPETNP